MNSPNSNIPEWLEDTQNKSWNPELLISGLSIVFLYTLSDQVSEFSIWMVQNYGLNPILVYFGSIYLSLAFTALKWTFTLHLILRGLWVGWLGLSYVFPKGIIFEKLPKSIQKPYIKKEIGTSLDRVILLEKICRSIFGLAFTVVGLSLFILIFFVFTFVLDIMGISLMTNAIFMFILMICIGVIVPLNHLLSKWKGVEEIKFLSKIYSWISRLLGILFFRESMMTFQSNASKTTF